MPVNSVADLDAGPQWAARYQNAIDAVVISGPGDEIRHFNAAAERLWGCRRDEVIGLPVNVLVPREVRATLEHIIALKAALPASAPVKGRREFRISRKDGAEAWGAFSISRVSDSGEPLYLSIVRDVTADVQRRQQNSLKALVAEKTDRVAMIMGPDARILYVNNAFTDLFGYSPAEALGRHCVDMLAGEYTDPETLKRFGQCVLTEGCGQEDLLVYDKHGEAIWISTTVNADRDECGQIRHLIAVLTDITESKQIHSLQHHALANLANDMQVADVMSDLCRRIEAIAPDVICSVLHVDAEGRLHPFGGDGLPSAFSESIDGLPLGPDVGCCGAAAFSGEPTLSTDIWIDPRWLPYNELLAGTGVRACWSTPIKAKDGRVIGALGFYFREPKGPSRWHQTIVDSCVHLCALALERHEASGKLNRLAYFDALTGLPNRARLRQIVTGQLDVCSSQDRIAVMFLDIDHFKDINDTLGHSLGDELLIKVTRRLSRLMRPVDTLSRQGGDEYVMVMPGCDAEGAAAMAKRVMNVLLRPIEIGAKAVPVSASIGISIFPDDARDIDDLLRHADAAMYQAKGAGRSTYHFFSADLYRISEERLAFSTALRNAILEGGLRLHYQPQIRGDGSVYGVEALARWNDPVLGEVPPSKFIPLAEEYGLIEMIGTWSLREACRQIATWRNAGLDVPCVSVNMSPINFQKGDLSELVEEILAENQLSPDMLMLEITEGVVMSEHSTAIGTMEKIRQSGVRLSMDDFGTGYSSLSRLADLPVRELKIDRSFMRNIESESGALAITLAIVRVGQSLGMTVVAEGVETEGQRALLMGLGCDVTQGYVHAPALSVPDFEEWLAAHQAERALKALKDMRGLASTDARVDAKTVAVPSIAMRR